MRRPVRLYRSPEITTTTTTMTAVNAHASSERARARSVANTRTAVQWFKRPKATAPVVERRAREYETRRTTKTGGRKSTRRRKIEILVPRPFAAATQWRRSGAAAGVGCGREVERSRAGRHSYNRTVLYRVYDVQSFFHNIKI